MTKAVGHLLLCLSLLGNRVNRSFEIILWSIWEFGHPFSNKFMNIPVAAADSKWPKPHPLEQEICLSVGKQDILKHFKQTNKQKALTDTSISIVLSKQNNNMEPWSKAKFVSEKPCPPGENNENTAHPNFRCEQHPWESSGTNGLE